MITEGLKKRLDILLPARQYPREMLIASLIYFFYLFTWLGWSAWMPFYLSTEKHLGFQTMGRFLSVWMFCAIFAYWICGWLCDLFGRRWVIPMFAIPAAILMVVMGQIDSAAVLFWVGLATNFLITGSFGTGLGYTAELFPTHRHRVFGCRRSAAARAVVLDAGAPVRLLHAGHDAQGAHRFRGAESCLSRLLISSRCPLSSDQSWAPVSGGFKS